MVRQFILVGFVASSVGCAGTWDTLTSRRFRTEPLTTMGKMVNPEDPVVVLRSNPPRDGDELAKAMRRLKEPIKNGGSPDDQTEMLNRLAEFANASSSPVLRLAAIEALGRFEDPRAPTVLMYAYQNAHGRPAGDGAGEKNASVASSPIVPVSHTPTPSGRQPERFPLSGPTGFSPETVGVIRCRSLESLGKTGRPEAAKYLASVVTEPPPADNPDEREVRLAAVRGLSKCRQPESVVALAHVLKADGKDAAVAGRAHEGLVSLTGKRLPPDPQQWDQVVQAGVTIAPEPTWVQNAVQTAGGILK